MSGDGKRGAGLRPQATAPILESTTAPLRWSTLGTAEIAGTKSKIRERRSWVQTAEVDPGCVKTPTAAEDTTSSSLGLCAFCEMICHEFARRSPECRRAAFDRRTIPLDHLPLGNRVLAPGATLGHDIQQEGL